jgi:hypothetical protein
LFTVNYLEPGSVIKVIPEIGKFGYAKESINIYCLKGREKDISDLLLSCHLAIDIKSDDFNCFSGSDPSEVETAFLNHNSLFSFNLLSRDKKRVMNLNPFNSSCIGISTSEEYAIHLNSIRLDLTRLALLVGGVVVFFASAKLSGNEAFFYLTSIGAGNLFSILVLIWFISKLIPKVRNFC